MEDLAVVTALNHLGSFGKNFVKLKEKIKMLYPSLGLSVQGKTVPFVLSTASGSTQNLGSVFLIWTSLLANNIY